MISYYHLCWFRCFKQTNDWVFQEPRTAVFYDMQEVSRKRIPAFRLANAESTVFPRASVRPRVKCIRT